MKVHQILFFVCIICVFSVTFAGSQFRKKDDHQERGRGRERSRGNYYGPGIVGSSSFPCSSSYDVYGNYFYFLNDNRPFYYGDYGNYYIHQGKPYYYDAYGHYYQGPGNQKKYYQYHDNIGSLGYFTGYDGLKYYCDSVGLYYYSSNQKYYYDNLGVFLTKGKYLYSFDYDYKGQYVSTGSHDSLYDTCGFYFYGTDGLKHYYDEKGLFHSNYGCTKNYYNYHQPCTQSYCSFYDHSGKCYYYNQYGLLYLKDNKPCYYDFQGSYFWDDKYSSKSYYLKPMWDTYSSKYCLYGLDGSKYWWNNNCYADSLGQCYYSYDNHGYIFDSYNKYSYPYSFYGQYFIDGKTYLWDDALSCKYPYYSSSYLGNYCNLFTNLWRY